MQRILALYLQSSLHVSFSVAAFTGLSFWQYHFDFDLGLMAFNFCASVVAYNFIKYLPLRYWRKIDLLQQFPFVMAISFICMFGLLISLFYVSMPVLLYSVFLGFLVFWYTFPLTQNSSNLRQKPLLKLLIIAFVWASVSLIFPWLNQRNNSVELTHLLFDFTARMVWVMALLIPFEIRDLNSDQQNGTSLISVLGIHRAKLVMIGLVGLFFILSFIFDKPSMPLNVLIYLSLIIMLLITRQKQHRYYSALWVESLPIVWLAFIWLME